MRLLPTLLAVLCALLIAGCATERLDASAPRGVNLTGEWNFNPNLSDDPSNLGKPDNTPQRAPGSHRGRGGGRGGGGGNGGSDGGVPPLGSSGAGGYHYLPVANMSQPPGGDTSNGGARGDSQAGDGPPAGAPRGANAPGGPPGGRRPGLNSPLKAPQHLSITQQGSSVIIRTNMPDGTQTVDEYTAGLSTRIPYGHDSTADRSAGWRGPVFVITTDAKKDGWREDDLAIDDDGRLIMTTDTKGGRLGKLELKRVYDRARGTGS